MIRIAIALSLSVFAAACGKGSSCDDVVDHIEKVSGFKIPDEARSGALAKCDKMTAEQRDCALKASDLASLQACK